MVLHRPVELAAVTGPPPHRLAPSASDESLLAVQKSRWGRVVRRGGVQQVEAPDFKFTLSLEGSGERRFQAPRCASRAKMGVGALVYPEPRRAPT
jgi:hypothetical protein